MENVFFKKFLATLKKKISTNNTSLVTSARMRQSIKKSQNTEGEDDSGELPDLPDPGADEGGESSDEGEGDGDNTDAKQRARHDQEREYEEPEEGENADQSDGEAGLDGSLVKLENTEDGEELIEKQPKQKKRSRKITEQDIAERKKFVLSVNPWIKDYSFDERKQKWCEVVLQLNLASSKLDMASLLEDEAKKTVVHETKGIKRAFLVKDHKTKGGCGKMLTTEGVNILEIFKYNDLIDVNRIYSNSIHSIANTYGIEAAARALFREVTNVFGAYGIEVDSRHLFLIADYMTFDGTYRACNRSAMESNASPLQQMTFETTMAFLKTATLAGIHDDLKSPSSRLILGQVVGGGTGCFDLMQPRGGIRKK